MAAAVVVVVAVDGSLQAELAFDCKFSLYIILSEFKARCYRDDHF